MKSELPRARTAPAARDHRLRPATIPSPRPPCELLDKQWHAIGVHEDAVDHAFRQNPITNDFLNKGRTFPLVECRQELYRDLRAASP